MSEVKYVFDCGCKIPKSEVTTAKWEGDQKRTCPEHLGSDLLGRITTCATCGVEVRCAPKGQIAKKCNKHRKNKAPEIVWHYASQDDFKHVKHDCKHRLNKCLMESALKYMRTTPCKDCDKYEQEEYHYSEPSASYNYDHLLPNTDGVGSATMSRP